MRILIATHNYAFVEDLHGNYADVDIWAAVGSFTEALNALERNAGGIDTVVLDAWLSSEADAIAHQTIAKTLHDLREHYPEMRIAVLSAGGTTLPDIDEVGAEHVIISSGEKRAGALANKLGLIPAEKSARIIAVTGLEGGAGRTTVAMGIAASAAERAGRRPNGGSSVVLCEMDIRRPTSIGYDMDHQTSMIVENGRQTIARLLGAPPFLGDTMISSLHSAIVTANLSRRPYDTLLAPYGMLEIDAALGHEISTTALTQRLGDIITALSATYRVVVLDLPNDPVIDPTMMLGIRRAHAWVVVATASRSGLASVVALSGPLRALGIIEKTKLVLNRMGHKPTYASYAATMAQMVPDLKVSLEIEIDSRGEYTPLTTALLEAE